MWPLKDYIKQIIYQPPTYHIIADQLILFCVIGYGDLEAFCYNYYHYFPNKYDRSLRFGVTDVQFFYVNIPTLFPISCTSLKQII